MISGEGERGAALPSFGPAHGLAVIAYDGKLTLCFTNNVQKV